MHTNIDFLALNHISLLNTAVHLQGMCINQAANIVYLQNEMKQKDSEILALKETCDRFLFQQKDVHEKKYAELDTCIKEHLSHHQPEKEEVIYSDDDMMLDEEEIIEDKTPSQSQYHEIDAVQKENFEKYSVIQSLTKQIDLLKKHIVEKIDLAEEVLTLKSELSKLEEEKNQNLMLVYSTQVIFEYKKKLFSCMSDEQWTTCFGDIPKTYENFVKYFSKLDKEKLRIVFEIDEDFKNFFLGLSYRRNRYAHPVPNTKFMVDNKNIFGDIYTKHIEKIISIHEDIK